MGIKFF